jgi:hypothetical protein
MLRVIPHGCLVPEVVTLLASIASRTADVCLGTYCWQCSVVPLGLAGSSELKRYSLDPKDVGIPRCEVADLAGGDAALNAQILRDVFGGARGAVADALNLNAGYALAACQVAANPLEGVAMAQEVQQAGKAADVLSKWIAVSNDAHQQEQQQQQHSQLATAAA